MSKKTLACALLSLTLLSGGLQAQFARTYGGIGVDSAISILATPDDGFLVFGSTTSFGTETGLKPCLIKLAPDGSLQWAKTYNVVGLSSLDSICRTPDGGYVMAGGAGMSVWLAKTGSAGEALWHKTITNNVWSSPEAPRYRVCPAGDAGFFLIGSMVPSDTSSVWVVRFDSSGNVIWQRAFGFGSGEYGRCGEATADGGVVVAGLTGGNCAFVFKIDVGGDISWQKVYMAIDYASCDVVSLERSEGGYILAGTLANSDDWGNQSDQTGFVYKIGDDGTLLWARSFSYADVGGGSATSDGGFVAAGSIGADHFFVIKFLADGDIEWQNAFGGCFEEGGADVVQTPAGDYAAAGFTRSFGAGEEDILAIRVSTEGVLGSCRFSVGSSFEGKTPNITVGDAVLSEEDTFAVPETAELEVLDMGDLLETYRLCADDKLLTILANMTVPSTTTTPPLGTHTYALNESVTVSAAATVTINGYANDFYHWEGDVLNSTNPLTISMADDVTIKAYYQPHYEPPYDPNPPPSPRLPKDCFIATAAFGSPLDPSVKLLREFRDKRLLTNGIGRAFVAAYTRWSPPAADVIARSGALRVLACVLLIPVIAMAFLVLKLGWIPVFLLIAAATAAIARRKSLKRRVQPT